MHCRTSCRQQKRMHCSTSCLNRYTKSYLLCIKLIDKPCQKPPPPWPGRVSYIQYFGFLSVYRVKEGHPTKENFILQWLFVTFAAECVVHSFWFFLHRLWKKESINRNRKVSAIDNRLSAIIVPSLHVTLCGFARIHKKGNICTFSIGCNVSIFRNIPIYRDNWMSP